jgi:hypothetical protein
VEGDDCSVFYLLFWQHMRVRVFEKRGKVFRNKRDNLTGDRRVKKTA